MATFSVGFYMMLACDKTGYDAKFELTAISGIELGDSDILSPSKTSINAMTKHNRNLYTYMIPFFKKYSIELFQPTITCL